MKTWRAVKVAGAAVVAAGFCVGAVFALRAHTGELQLVSPDAIVQAGTFFSMQLSNYPPLPFNPQPQLDVYAVSGAPGCYFYDDRILDYPALRQQRQVESALRSLERQYGLDSPEDGPPPFDGGGDSGGDYSPPPVSPAITYPDGSLWLSIVQITNGEAPLTIHGTIPEGLYEIQSEPGVTDSAWASEGGVLGAANQNWTPATVAVGDRTNSLFLRAIYWPDCDGFGTPAAWYWQHGLNPLAKDIALQDPDGDGLLNWQEYLWGTDPQSSEGFSVWVSSPAGYSGIP
jgi:hypothetical protein